MGGGVHFLLICSLVAKIQTIVCFESRRNSSSTIWPFFRSESFAPFPIDPCSWGFSSTVATLGPLSPTPAFCQSLGSVGPWVLWAPGFCGPQGSVSPWVLWAPGFCGPQGSVGPWVLLAPGFCGPLGSGGPSADLSEQFLLLSQPEAPPKVILQPLEKTGNKKAYQSKLRKGKWSTVPFLLHLQVMIDICVAVTLN